MTETPTPATPQPLPTSLLDDAVQLGFVGAHANPKMADSPYLAILLEELANAR